MKNKLKLLRAFLTVLMISVMALVFASCDQFLDKPLLPEPEDAPCYHEYGDWVTVTEATCTSEGLERRTCTKNSSHFEERTVAKKSHSFSSTLSGDAVQHWYECACGEKKDVVNHGFNTTFVTDDYSHWFECECGVKTALTKHDFDEGIVLTPATCTSTGIASVTCSICGYQDDDHVIPKLAHDYNDHFESDATGHWQVCECGDKTVAEDHVWDNGTVTKDATCAENGEITYACTVCGFSKTAKSPKGDHDYENVEWVSDANSHWKKCKNCETTSANGDHEWDGGEETLAATCTSEGSKHYTCTVCSATKDEVIAKLAHDYEGAEWLHDETSHWKKCNNCDATSFNGDHAWGEGVVTEDPTCTTEGVKTFTCECSVTKTESVAVVPHDYEDVDWSKNEDSHWKECKKCGATSFNADHAWNDGVVTTEPTCTTEGVKTFTCECGATKTAPIAKNDHSNELKSDADNHWYECVNCGATSDHESHTWDEGTVDPAPSCTAEGKKTYECTDAECTATKEEILNKLDHDYENVDWSKNEDSHWKECKNCGATSFNGDHVWDDGVVTTEPTCTTEGVKTFTCECGATETEPVAVEPHDYEGVEWSKNENSHWKECKRCGATSFNGDHVWDDGVVTTEPTCTTEGVKTFTCECGATETEPVAVEPHDYEGVEWSDNKDFHWKECKNCGATSFNGDHEWDEGEVTADSDCTKDGEKTFTCQVCSATRVEIINKKDHDFTDVEWSTDGEKHWKQCKNCTATRDDGAHTGGTADCTHQAVCEVCNTAYGELDSTKHKGGEATCKNAAICEDCGQFYGSTDASNHESNRFTYTADPEDPASHYKAYNCCGYAVSEAHSGGEATCTDRAKCDYCKTYYGEIVASNHIIKKVAKKDPGCESEGCEAYWLCQECNTAFADEALENVVEDLNDLVIEAHGHDYQKTSGYDATCTSDGVEVSTCSYCDGTKETVIPALDHTWVHSDEDSLAADCQTVGYNVDKCSVCKETRTVETLEKTACQETVETFASTCSVAGKNVYTCSTCGNVREEVLPLADHQYESTSVAATCLTDGYTLYECSVCEASYQTKTADKLGHRYAVDAAQSIERTCLVDGKTVEVCQNDGCGDTKVTDLEAEGHKFSPATCTVAEICSECNATGAAALGHNFEGNVIEDVHATCLDNGHIKYACKNGCGETETVVPDDYRATGHNEAAATWTETVVAVENRICTFQTKRTAVCPDCNATLESLGEEYVNHTYAGTLVTPAKCNAPGEMTYACSVCSEAGETDNNYYPQAEAGTEVDLHKWSVATATVSEEAPQYTHVCDYCGETKFVLDASSGISADKIKDADEIQTGDAAISFDQAAKDNLEGEISIKAENLTVEDLDEELLKGLDEDLLGRIQNNQNGILSLEATKDGVNFGDESSGGFNGKVTVRIPYVLEEGDDPNEIVVYYFGETLTAMKAVYTEIDGQGYATFETEHFSYYTVTRMTPAERCKLYGHRWDGVDGAGKTFKASCLEKGYTLRTCLRCKDQKITDEVEALGHDFVIDGQTESTCTLDGKVTHACDRCDVSYEVEVKALGHNFVVIDSSAADCTTAGYETLKCTNCDETHTTNIAKLAHVYTSNKFSLSCTTAGYTEHTCTNCGYVAITDYVEATGHKIASKIVPATCTSVGYTENWCEVCNEKFAITDITELSNLHNWNVDEPDCVTDKVCLDCNKLAENGKALGHYVDDGFCQRCGEDFSKYCDHTNLGEGSTLELKHHVPSSCHSHGYDQYVCKVCKKKVKINNEELDEHKYEFFKSTEATCTTAAYTVEVCKHCNAQNKVETAPALGHNFVGSSCERCGLSNETFYLNMLETWMNVDGFAITIKDLSFIVHAPTVNDAGETVWEIVGEIAQIDLAELMLYVDSEGNLQGAAQGAMKIFNGPIEDAWATYGLKAVIDNGICYVYVYGDMDGINKELSLSIDVDWFIEYALDELFDLDSEMTDLLSGWAVEDLLPIIAMFRDANANEIDSLVGKLVNLVFTSKVENGNTVYYFDYDKLRQLNDDLLNLTVEEVIDKYFGEGSFANLAENILKIASMKLSEIPEFAESLGIDPYDLADAINNLCYLTGAPEEFDIMDLISEEAYGAMTVGDLINAMFSDNGGGEEPPIYDPEGGMDGSGDSIGDSEGEFDNDVPEFDSGDIVNPGYDAEDPGYDVVLPVKPIDPDKDYVIATTATTEEVNEFIAQLEAMLAQVGEMKLYEAMAGADGAAQVHAMVDSVITMAENFLTIEITTDQTGAIIEYEISLKDFEFQPSQDNKVIGSVTVNLYPGARLDLDLSEVIGKVKDETKVPALEDTKESGMEPYGSWQEKDYEYNGKFYYAQIQEVEFIYKTVLRSLPKGILSYPSCKNWKELELAYSSLEEYTVVRMVMLADPETGSMAAMLYANEKTGEYLVVEQVGELAIITYPDGTVKEFDANSQPDFRELFPESWWSVSADIDSDHFYYDPTTGEIAKESPHSYFCNEELSKPSTSCGDAGYRYYECEYCGDSYKDYYNDFSHNFQLVPEKSTIAENCGEMSISYYECTECGESYTSHNTKEHDLQFNYQLMDGAESCEDGVITRHLCVNCGYDTGYYRVQYGHVIGTKSYFDGEAVYYSNECLACGESSDGPRVHFNVETDLEIDYLEENSDYWTTEFKFVPTESGVYQFYTKNCNSDPYGAILDSNYNRIVECDNYYYHSEFGKGESGNGCNFAIAAELVAGETYYIIVGDHQGYNSNAFTFVADRRESVETDLAEYGCACGGKMIVTSNFIYKEVGFELNCDAGHGKPCSVCGFVYFNEGGRKTDDNCNEIEYLDYYLVSGDGSKVAVNIYSIPTGYSSHNTYEDSYSEDLYDESGKAYGHRKVYLTACSTCGSEISKVIYENHYDESGYTVYEARTEYQWSSSLSECVISYSDETRFAMIDFNGDVRQKTVWKKYTYYSNGVVSRFEERNYTYNPDNMCEVHVVSTDMNGNTSQWVNYEHNTRYETDTQVTEGEWNGTPVTIRTQFSRHTCIYCGTVTSCNVYERYVDENGNELVVEDRSYYDAEGMIPSRVNRREFGFFEYAPDSFTSYILLESNIYYDNDGNITDGWADVYNRRENNPCVCERSRIYYYKDGTSNEEFYGEETNHLHTTWHYVLGENSQICTDGLDYVYECLACGEEFRREVNSSYEHNFVSSYTYVDGIVYRTETCQFCQSVNGESDKYFSIVSDETLEYSQNRNGYVCFKYVPTTNAAFNISSVGDFDDPRIHIYNSMFEEIGYNDDYQGLNFAIRFEFVAGETYYLGFERCNGVEVRMENAIYKNIDLAEYGCACGGNVVVYNSLRGDSKEYNFISNCPMDYNGEFGYSFCTVCGFAYRDVSGYKMENCEEIYYVNFLFGTNGTAVEEFTEVELFSYKTGHTSHMTYGTDETVSEEAIDENGNAIVIETQTYSSICRQCGKVTDKTVYIRHYDENGNTLLDRREEYNFSSVTSEIYLHYVNEYSYVMLDVGNGELNRYQKGYYNAYYNYNGELTSWNKTEYVYGNTPCDLTRVETDSNGNRYEYEESNHSTEQKDIPDETGTSEDGLTYTHAYEIFCNVCGASIEKYVNIDHYDEYGHTVKHETEHYVPYAKSETEYGYRLESRETVIYGVYEYSQDKFVTYTISSITERFDKDGNSTGSNGTRYEYLNGSYCEYNEIRVVDGVDQKPYGPNTNHKATRYGYKLHEGAVSCLDGLDYYRFCDCCGFEKLQYTNYRKDHLQENSTREIIDMTPYSDCGGYIDVYSCPCGQRKFVDTNSLGCSGALGSRNEFYYHSWNSDGTKYNHNKYVYGCSVTHDANGENPCGFEYSVETWISVDANCVGSRHYVYVFGVGSENPIEISYSYVLNSTYHRYEWSEEKVTEYTEDGYYVVMVEREYSCSHCDILVEKTVTKTYYNDEAHTDSAKRTVERSEYTNGLIRYINFTEYEYIVDAYGNKNSYSVFDSYTYYNSDNIIYNYSERTYEYDRLASDDKDHVEIVCVKEIYRSGSSPDNLTYYEERVNEYDYINFDDVTSEFKIVKESYKSGNFNGELRDSWTKTYEYDIIYSADKREWIIVTVREFYENLDGYTEEILHDYSSCRYTPVVTYIYSDRTEPYVTQEQHYWYDWYTRDYGYEVFPTCTDGGLSQRRCEWCHATESFEVSAHGHSYIYDSEKGYDECRYCGLVNFTGYDGAVTYEDVTSKYGDGTCYVISYYLNYDKISEYELWVSAIVDGELVDFLAVDPVIDGNRIYLYADALTEALAIINEDYGTEYDLCNVSIRLAFVPKTDSSNFDCAITLDPHLPVYSGNVEVDENGQISHTHTVTCALCEENLVKDPCEYRTASYYEYVFNGEYYEDSYVYEYFCQTCGFRYKTSGSYGRDASDPCARVRYNNVHYGYENGVYTELVSTETSRRYYHNYQYTALERSEEYDDIFCHNMTCLTCGIDGGNGECYGEYTESFFIDENGIEHRILTIVCDACGRQYAEESFRVLGENCTARDYLVFHWDLDANGEYQKSFERVGGEMTYHNVTVELVDNGDGSYSQITTCTGCDSAGGTIKVTVNSEFEITPVLYEKNSALVLYAITPTVSGTYNFYSTDNTDDNGRYDTYGELYNAEMMNLASDDDGNGDRNFYISYHLQAGETYYFASRMLNQSLYSGSYTVNIVKVS